MTPAAHCALSSILSHHPAFVDMEVDYEEGRIPKLPTAGQVAKGSCMLAGWQRYTFFLVDSCGVFLEHLLRGGITTVCRFEALSISPSLNNPLHRQSCSPSSARFADSSSGGGASSAASSASAGAAAKPKAPKVPSTASRPSLGSSSASSASARVSARINNQMKQFEQKDLQSRCVA